MDFVNLTYGDEKTSEKTTYLLRFEHVGMMVINSFIIIKKLEYMTTTNNLNNIKQKCFYKLFRISTCKKKEEEKRSFFQRCCGMKD